MYGIAQTERKRRGHKTAGKPVGDKGKAPFSAGRRKSAFLPFFRSAGDGTKWRAEEITEPILVGIITIIRFA